MTLLDSLAVRCGIEAEFEDGFSKTHRVSPETQRALLAAMGVQARDDEEVSTSLENITRAEWGGPLPPVRVAYHSEAVITLLQIDDMTNLHALRETPLVQPSLRTGDIRPDR